MIGENVSMLKEQLDEAVSSIRNVWSESKWSPTAATAVPEPNALGYKDAKTFDATYLYADMMDSSGLVVAAGTHTTTVASVMAAFLKVNVRMIRSEKGHIRSFDGDRVMGIFAGPNKEDRAVRAALKIEYGVGTLLNPAIHKQFGSISNSGWQLRQMTGIATGQAYLIRTGIRDNDDLVSIGVTPNLAAKLSDLRTQAQNRTAIGAGTYSRLSDALKLSGGKNMWVGPYSYSLAGKGYNYFRTNYHLKVS